MSPHDTLSPDRTDDGGAQALKEIRPGTLRASQGRGGILGKSQASSGAGIWYSMAILLALLLATPIVIYHLQAFVDGAGGFRRMVEMPNLWEVLGNTVFMAVGSTAISVVLAVILAKATLHIPAKLRGLSTMVPLLPLVAPGVAIVIGWAFMFSPSVGYVNGFLRSLPFFPEMAEGPFNVYSLTAIVLITGLDLTGVVFLLVLARMQEIRGPLEAAAQLAGATPFRGFMTITLPLMRPAIATGALVTFLLALGQFTAPLFLGSRQGIDVLSTAIFRLREVFPTDWAVMAALGFPLLLVGIAAVVVQRTVVGDQRKYVTQTGGGGGIRERSSVWAVIAVVLFALIAVIMPLVGIVLVAFSPFWSGSLSTVDWTLTHFRAAFDDPGVWESVSNSLVTSVIAVLIAIPIGFIAALATTRVFKAPRLAQFLFDFSFQMPLAVPRAVLGLSLLYVFIRPPFSLYGTIALFVLGYVFIVLPFALRSQQSSLIGISGSLFEAARISGAGYVRTIVDIALPLVRRGVVAGATLGLVLVLHDFAVSIMVRSPGTHVMGTKLYDLWESGVYPEVAVMSIIMAVVTGIVLALTLWIGGRSVLKSL